eukprot:CAMPEP_0113902898 /NCGR_PEP_ID=MMETSP0780_2-20120614/22142_1 /TAXON_ID=652834 /ORGANISM="Palpitomonas bilix" /LENGTH=223 /DNA_ID=CAMNT_0000895827 /DNA_START=131 /DNA_END=802 /DNA_ORIENTATION=- /assembly_acc=CAM_ASM_000599
MEGESDLVRSVQRGEGALPPRKGRRGKKKVVEEVEETEEMNKEEVEGGGASKSEEAGKKEGGKEESEEGRADAMRVEEEFEHKFEYRDHTADIQLYSWGDTLEEAFEQVVIAMFNYMVELRVVDIDYSKTRTIEVEGHSMTTLLFELLSESLFQMSEFFVIKRIKITKLDRANFKIKAVCFGETFDRIKHEDGIGTEVKAPTYNYMQIEEGEERSTVTVIVDI